MVNNRKSGVDTPGGGCYKMGDAERRNLAVTSPLLFGLPEWLFAQLTPALIFTGSPPERDQDQEVLSPSLADSH